MTNLTPHGAMTIREFMDWASVSHTTVYRNINQGHLKAVKAGRRTLIPFESAKSWLDNLPEIGGRS